VTPAVMQDKVCQLAREFRGDPGATQAERDEALVWHTLMTLATRGNDYGPILGTVVERRLAGAS
jgi:hypothetical protein